MLQRIAAIKSNRKGFTLIELLVVVSIVGVLSSLVLVSMKDVRAKARDSRRKTDIDQIRRALELYYLDNGQYPSSGGTGAVWPNNGWSNSRDQAWYSLALTNSLAYQLQPYLTLPNDPLNSAPDWQTYYYSYYSNNYGCSRQWYMLVYKLEKTPMVSPGVTTCPYTGYPNGYTFNYAGTITIGMKQK